VDVKRYLVLLQRAVDTVLEPIRKSVYGGKDEECLYLFPVKNVKLKCESGALQPKGIKAVARLE
jgi:hypothetical protein